MLFTAIVAEEKSAHTHSSSSAGAISLSCADKDKSCERLFCSYHLNYKDENSSVLYWQQYFSLHKEVKFYESLEGAELQQICK